MQGRFKIGKLEFGYWVIKLEGVRDKKDLQRC